MLTRSVMIKRVRQWVGLVGVLLIPLAVRAADSGRMEKSLDATANPRVSLSNFRGRVVVKGWDRSQVHALCATGSPKIELDVESMPSKGPTERVRFLTHAIDPQANANEEDGDYSLDVPLNSTLDIRTPQGSVRIERVQGDIHVSTVGAPVAVFDTQGHLQVESVAGNIEIVRSAGRVEVSSVNGDIHFLLPASREVRANTTSGRIVYEGSFVPNGGYDLATYSGDVDVISPATASFELIAKTKGRVSNDFRMTPKPHMPSISPYGTGFFGTYHEGKATVDVRSFSGAIHIRQKQ